MKPYELMVIVDPDIGGDATKKYLDEVRKLIAAQKGEIFFEDVWGIKDMAYPIKKRDRGYYVVIDFNGMPDSMKEIDATLRLDNEVLRHMIISLPKGYEAKSFLVSEEEEEAAKAEEKKPEAAKKAAPKRAPKKEVSEEEVTEEPEVKAEEVSEEETKKKAAPKKKAEAKPEEPSLEEVDAKLRSIIDNPDINF